MLVLCLLAQPPGKDSTDTEAGGEQHQHVGEDSPKLYGGPDQLGVEPALPCGGVWVQFLAGLEPAYIRGLLQDPEQ